MTTTTTPSRTALFADLDTRTLRGLLLPFGEMSRRSVTTDPVMFAKGDVTLPRDPEIVTLNEGHSQFAPVGRAIELTETERGIEAAFKVANTPEGDDLLLRASDPDESKRPRLSAEVAGLVRRGKRAAARLTGAAVVPMGAFASAGLFELAEGEEEQVEEAVEEAVATAESADLVAEADPALVDLIAEAVIERLDQTSADPGEDTTSTNNEGSFAMKHATVPAGVTAPARRPASLDGLFAAIANKDVEGLKRYAGAGDLFAIDTIQHSGPTGETIGADTAERGYLGELWSRNAYQRRYVPLFASQGLTSYTAVGWRWTEEPEVDDYAGNTAEVPSDAVDTEMVTVTASRLAGGHKLDRRFRDFGDQSVIESYFRKMSESYARKSDARCLTAAVNAATPVGVSEWDTRVALGLNAIVDGALAVIDSENTPSFAIVSKELWRAIVLTGKDDAFAFLAAGFGLEEGSVEGFKVIPGNVGTGKVLVGAKPALTFFELPGSPIRVEGIDPHHGAIDPALFGYWAAIANAPAALALVDTDDYEGSGVTVIE